MLMIHRKSLNSGPSFLMNSEASSNIVCTSTLGRVRTGDAIVPTPLEKKIDSCRNIHVEVRKHVKEGCMNFHDLRWVWIFVVGLFCIGQIKNQQSPCSIVTTPRAMSILDLAASYEVGMGAKGSSSSLRQSVQPVKKWSDVKLAIYMTTHLSPTHISFLPCWHDAIQRLEIFRYADLILYTPETIYPVPNKILEQLPFRNTTIKYFNNTGYQNGAVQAMIDPFLVENNENGMSWFDNYDWVIRLNPDVLIRNDTWLIHAMMDESIDAVFHDCFNRKLYPSDNVRHTPKFHSDFTAFRPRAIQRDLLLSVPVERINHLNTSIVNAEIHLTESLWNIYQSKRFAYLEGGENSKPGRCRLEGMNSPVLHVHQLAKFCPYYYSASKEGLY